MEIALGAAMLVLLQLVSVDELVAGRALHPTTVTIFFGGLDFNLRLMSGKQTHNKSFVS